MSDEPRRCTGFVDRPWGCDARGKVEIDGRWYCGRHEPGRAYGHSRGKRRALADPLPCPFCGGPGCVVEVPRRNEDHGYQRMLGCFSPRCAVRPRVAGPVYLPALVRAWNARVLSPQSVAEQVAAQDSPESTTTS